MSTTPLYKHRKRHSTFEYKNWESLEIPPTKLEIRGKKYKLLAESVLDNYLKESMKTQWVQLEITHFKILEYEKELKKLREAHAEFNSEKTTHTKKLSAILFAGTMTTLIGATLLLLPLPYSIAGAIALGGPLSVSLYGLKRMK